MKGGSDSVHALLLNFHHKSRHFSPLSQNLEIPVSYWELTAGAALILVQTVRLKYKSARFPGDFFLHLNT